MATTDTSDTTTQTRSHRTNDAETPAWPIIVAVVLFLAGWGVCIAIWGVPGLYIPALILVPVIWVILLLISRG